MKLYDDKYVPEDAKERRDIYIKLPGNEDFETMLAKAGGEVVDGNTLHFPVKDATKTVILIPGGRGAVEIWKDSEYPQGHLVPSSLIPHFQKLGINVTLIHSGKNPLPWLINVLFAKVPGIVLNDTINTPTKWLENHASFNLKRALHSVHVISKSMARAVRQSDVPVWLFGQCSSNFLVARHYHLFQDSYPIEGLIMSSVNSPPTQINKYYERCNFFRKNEEVTVPFHVIHHAQDISDYTDVDTCQLILDQFEFVESKLHIVDGGWNEGHPKLNFGYHGFRGIEKEVVQIAADVINNR